MSDDDVRCPRCWSKDVVVDGAVFESTPLRCRACGHRASVDWMEMDAWRGAVPPYGCPRCFGADADGAWAAMRATRVRSLVQESHFGVHVARCACGQHYVEVFTERIDWRDGDDDQTWLVAPLTIEDVARLMRASEAELHAIVNDAARGRRFLVRHDGRCWWRDDGFAIGPHD